MRFLSLLVLAAALTLAQSQPVATQPFGPIGPRQQAILNGCTESELFAVLNSPGGGNCLRNALPRYANRGSDYSVFCNAGRWGCCMKTIGFGSCKIEGEIPVLQRLTPPPVTQYR